MKIKINNLHKVFQKGDIAVDVLKGVNFDIDSGETVAITGPSGSGKTTLLQIIGLLDSPSDGSVNINDEDESKSKESDYTSCLSGYITVSPLCTNLNHEMYLGKLKDLKTLTFSKH